MTGVEIVALNEITLRDARQRQEIPEKHIEELRKSILDNGLFHSILVDQDGEVRAGDCRTRAIIKLAEAGLPFFYGLEEVIPGRIPVLYTHKTEERELFKIELEENLRRKALTHIEEAVAIAELFEYYKVGGSSRPKMDTAEALVELGQQQALSTSKRTVADALILNEFKDDPDVKNARTSRAAVRIATRKAEQNVMSALGSLVDVADTPHQIYLGDAHDFLRHHVGGYFDGIITDPPYGVDASEFGEASFLGAGHSYSDTEDDALKAARSIATEGFRVCKPQAHCYVFCDIGRFNQLAETFTKAGWSVWKTPLIWYKGTTAHAPRPDYGPKRTYEAILFANKGDKKIQYCGLDTLIRQSVFRDDKLHPAEKPVEVYDELIRWSFMPGSTILDPFCGSGPIFPACSEAKCIAVGFEQDETYFNIAKGRMTVGEE